MAKVFIANVSSTPTRYGVNGGPTFPGRPCSPGPAPPPYTPYFVFAPLDHYRDTGVFGYGPNTLVVTFEDDGPYCEPHAFSIMVPTTHSLDDPLLLYVFRGVVMLLTTRGMPLDPNPLLIHGTPEEPLVSARADDQEEPMPGDVYVFNCYNEPINTFNIANLNAGSIPGWSATAATLYTPAELKVPRTKYPADDKATFAIGSNQVAALWDSFTGSTDVEIPDPKDSDVSLDDDLILFLTKNEAILLTTRGFVKNTFKVNLLQKSGSPAATGD